MDVCRVWLRLKVGNKEHIHIILNNTSNLYHGAEELGNSRAYYSIGNAYDFGRGLKRDEKKAPHLLIYYDMRMNWNPYLTSKNKTDITKC